MKLMICKVQICFLLFSLLMGLLGGCHNSDTEPKNSAGLPVLSESKKKEIMTEYEKQKGAFPWDGWCDYETDNKIGLQYYGTYHKAIVFYTPSEIWGGEKVTIAGFEFNCANYQLRVYKNKKFYYLDEAYDLDFLSQKDILQINEYHTIYINWICESLT